jgi:tetratricopeptide (TPR) repeat protein
MHSSLKGKRAVYKSEMMMYEMLARCNWERPLYVAMTVGSENYGNLGNNFVQEGLANRLTPFNTKASGKRIDTAKMYDNMMNRFKFGGIDNPDLYLDETVLRMCYTHRRLFSQLASQLIAEGEKDKAKKVLEKAEKEIPEYNVPHSYQSGSLELAQSWLTLGEKKKAAHLAEAVAKNASEYCAWYTSLSDRRLQMSAEDCYYYLLQLSNALKILDETDNKAAETYDVALRTYFDQFQRRTNL